MRLTDKWHGGVPADHLPPISEMVELARGTRATMQMVPGSTGIGAPGTAPAPGSLATSPMASQPAGQSPQAIPFTRGSSLATMQDFTRSYSAGATDEVPLQTNAFLAYLILDVSLTTAGNSAAVAFAADAPFNVFQVLWLNDPANQAIITPVTGYQLYLLNKYLPDTGCGFDPQKDPNYSAVTGTGATGGSFSFRFVIPVEHRRRDALGAVNNSAANQRYQLNYTLISTFGGTTGLYTTAPTTPATSVTISATQLYWTSPPASIVTTQGSVAVNQTPTGLGTVGFVRFESHNEMSGGGSPQVQLNNVGDYISSIIFVNRYNGARVASSWPSPFQWWVNDFQVHNLTVNVWQRWMARYYGYTAALGSPGGLDTGVFVLPFLHDMFDTVGGGGNESPANQYLATDATTKLQVRGSNWGTNVSNVEVLTRLIKPVSGAALFA